MESLTLMPKYEVYKESGAEWLGDIPDSWELLSNKHIFTLKKKLVGKRSADYDLLSLTLRGIIKRDMDNPEGKFPAEFNTYQEVNFGDFVFCLFDVEETPRTVGLSSYDGMITGAYTVFQTNAGFDNKFLYYFYLNLDSTKRLKPLYRGLRNTIPKDSFMSFKTFVPPHEQQTLIAAFLDKKTAQIDDAIAIKEQQISLLKERKQIIIQQAVTRGLDPNVSMKDSEVEWIGKIPEHWDLVKLGSCLSPVSVKNCPELPLLSITREQGVIERDVDDKESNHNFIPDDLSGYKKLEKGQFGMNKMKAWQGSYGVSKFTGIVSPAYFIFDFTKAINPEFFNWAIRSKLYVSFFGSASDGVRIGQWDLSKARMKVIPFVLPCEEEQLLIAKHLDEKLEQVDVAIKIKLQQIERLREYKSSLINSAVTGKFKITPEMVEQ
ncbi:MAG: restriction endonuclease subunit S [Thiomicrorhabdus sp.]|nr:restriction endonuclease subunit S [Thiomicrorhabdus sp.]